MLWASLTATLKRNTTLTNGLRSFDPTPLSNRFRRWSVSYPCTSKSSSNTTSVKTYCYIKVYMIFRWNFLSYFVIVGYQHFHLMVSANFQIHYGLLVDLHSRSFIDPTTPSDHQNNFNLYAQRSMVLWDVTDPGIRELFQKYRSITSAHFNTTCSPTFPRCVLYHRNSTQLEGVRRTS